VWVLQLTTKIPSAIKCKCPQRRVTHPSRKSYVTKGIRAPSKYSSQVGGNWEKINLMESIKEDLRYPKGKEAEWGCLPTLAQT